MRRKEKPEEAGTGSTLFAFCCIVIQYAYMVVSEQDLRETGALPCRPVRKQRTGRLRKFLLSAPRRPSGGKACVVFFRGRSIFFSQVLLREEKAESENEEADGFGRTALKGRMPTPCPAPARGSPFRNRPLPKRFFQRLFPGGSPGTALPDPLSRAPFRDA